MSKVYDFLLATLSIGLLATGLAQAQQILAGLGLHF